MDPGHVDIKGVQVREEVSESGGRGAVVATTGKERSLTGILGIGRKVLTLMVIGI